MFHSTFQKAITVVIITIIAAGFAQAQRSWETIPAYSGMQVKNGMLVFSDKAAFDRVYQDLEQRIRDWNGDPNAVSPEESPAQPCPDDNVVLDLFEKQYRLSSIRKASLMQECEWLDSGRDPLGFEGHHVVDDILAALLNTKYQFQVGTDIFYLPHPGITYVVANADLAALQALERGENPYGIKNVTVHGPETGCMADFSVNTDYNTTTVGFAFVGQPQTGSLSYFWEFGDGQVSLLKNPVHSYNQAGEYQVCLTIESFGSQPCSDRICKTIQVGSGGCLPFFIYNETGQEGGICFLDNTQLQANVISTQWKFGDGSPNSNETNPCHTFPCDKTYFVTLTIETNAGCEGSITLPVEVSSYGCCSSFANLKDNHYYAGDTKRIKYHQYQLQIPLVYYRTIAKVVHYRLKPNGNWKREDANLKIDLLGNVFLSSQTGCKCQEAFNIAKTDMAFNKKTLTVTKGVGDWFKAKKQHEWSARYYVNNTLLTQQMTPVNCD